MDETMDSPQSYTSPTPTETTAEPQKIRKRPGRKPNPASPAVRKAQNRAAQRAFRQRKERHMKDLEIDTKRLIQERDQYYSENQKLNKENDILKCENWYLKGIVLSLQMVCFKSKLRIPRHTPHIDDRARQIMSSTIPPSIAAHLNRQDNSNTPATGSDQPHDTTGSSSSQPGDTDQRRYSHSNSNTTTTTTTTTNQESSTASPASNNGDTEGDTELAQPVMLNNHTDTAVGNNMAAIQALRFRLRIQSALFRENRVSYSSKPSALQLAVPHDPRIDLIPTVHMRDRMILFRDQFDLDDCLRLLINEAVYHGGDGGGDPTMAKNWELPAIFFEKYWYLTTDYTMERTSQRWRQLRNMFNDDLESSPPPLLRSPSATSLSPIPSSAHSHRGSCFNTDMESSEEAHHQHEQQQQHPCQQQQQQQQQVPHHQQQQQQVSHHQQQQQQVSYHHHRQQQQQQQQYWEQFGSENRNNNTSRQENQHTTNHHHPQQQPSTVATTDNDILALMTSAPSADVGSHYSPLAHTSPTPLTNVHQRSNYGVTSTNTTTPPLSQHDFVFRNDPVTQQDIQSMFQQGQQQQQQQQQQHTNQSQWNPLYSFMEL